MRKSFPLAMFVLFAWVLVPGVQAAQILVPDPGNGINTIQDGVNAAVDNDEVIVAAGTYDAFSFAGKAITVRSDSGPVVTIVSGTTGNQDVLFSSAEGNGSVLRGFTIRDGGQLFGSGVRISGASPIIEENIIQNNGDMFTGGGIFISSGSPIIRNNTIRNNNVTRAFAGGTPNRGGGIYITGSGAPLIVDNFILNNTQSCGVGFCIYAYGAGIFASGGSPVIIGNVLAGNRTSGAGCQYGGGVYLEGTLNAVVANNTLYNNTVTVNPLLPECGGAGAYLAGTNSGLLFANNIVQQNNGVGVLCGAGLGVTIETNNLFNNTVSDYEDCPSGTGDFFEDSGLVDPANGDFHLGSASPLLDVGTSGIPGMPTEDVYQGLRLTDGNGDGTAQVDLGADEFSDCVDHDGDGYGSPANFTCAQPELDCDDANPDVYPGAQEGPAGDPTCSDGLDNNCDGLMDAADPGCIAPPWGGAESAEASFYGSKTVSNSNVLNNLALLLIPVGAIFFLRILRRKR